MGFVNPIVGGTALRIPAIQSPDFQAGSAGWIIRIDGSAEFNNVIIRGGVIVSGTSLYYNGTPAAGNLFMSISAAAGTDSFGNAYVKGLGLYGASGQLVAKDTSGNVTTLSGNVGGGGLLAALPGLALQLAANTGDPATIGALDDGTHTNLSLLLTSPSNAVGGVPGTNFSQINLIGPDSAPCEINLDAQVLQFQSATTMNAGGVIDSYAADVFNTYTPTVAGAGTGTFSTRTGYWQRLGKLVFFNASFVMNAAGTGAANITVTTPTNINRTIRQSIPAQVDGAATQGSFDAVCFTGGTANVIDRLRSSTDTNLTGADLSAGAIVVIEGWYREA
jgi:hypothetical protein